ncbi:MAG: fibronectin type III domain-containing protein [Candidatus Levybacteria bacterium]|nr:fibronectin type III domain-containing protein [Candidatus Levybacteria bacterium]
MAINIKNWSGKRKVLVILAGVLAIVGLVITIFLVQKVQEIRSRAEKSTTLSLAPPNQSIDPGEDASLDVIMNPGVNQVNFVKFTINFDPEIFDPSLAVFNVNEDSPLEEISEPVFSDDGQATFTLSIGSDATKVVRETIKLGTLLLPVKDEAAAGEAEVSFNEDETQVRSLGSADTFEENVLSSTSPATVTITGICRPNIGTCSWDPSENATTYHFKVTDIDDNAIVVEGETSKTSVEFQSEPGKTYKCEVIAVNECGEAQPSEDQVTCPVPSATPTPSVTPTVTPSPTPSVTPTKSPTPTPTPTPTPSVTPTNTPTPTEEIENTPTPTPTPTPTTASQGGIETPTPTLPPTGNPVVITGIIGGVLFILGGIALLFL